VSANTWGVTRIVIRRDRAQGSFTRRVAPEPNLPEQHPQELDESNSTRLAETENIEILILRPNENIISDAANGCGADQMRLFIEIRGDNYTMVVGRSIAPTIAYI
jgi:hypothetical protein